MKRIEGGVCAAKGFTANGVHCGLRKDESRLDLAMIYSQVPASAAAVYTTNLVKGAPILVDQKNLADGVAQAVIVNSGNANTCNSNGVEIAEGMCKLTAEAIGVKAEDVIVASTGVIGQKLSLDPVISGMAPLAAGLSAEGSSKAASAIMTTDTIMKEAAVEFELDGKTCHLGGISKGSGMIHPNMATMLAFVTTDVAITPEMLKKILKADADKTFNMISVDGDTSTNDTYAIMANGLAGNALISEEGPDADKFAEALNTVTEALARMMAGDGEGASKLLECKVTGAKTEEAAKTVAKSVICSSLVKAAMFGADANWGRVLCAIGYSGADVDINKVDLTFRGQSGSVKLCEDGHGLDFSEELAKEILLEKEIGVDIDLKDGEASATAWGCDLTYDYVKINGSYRT